MNICMTTTTMLHRRKSNNGKKKQHQLQKRPCTTTSVLLVFLLLNVQTLHSFSLKQPHHQPRPRDGRRVSSLSSTQREASSAHATSNNNSNANDDVIISEDQLVRNKRYISGLIEKLDVVLEKWFCSGSPGSKAQAYNILNLIVEKSLDDKLVEQSRRMASRAMLLDDYDRDNNINDKSNTERKDIFMTGQESHNTNDSRSSIAQQRKEFEQKRRLTSGGDGQSSSSPVNKTDKPRSALSARSQDLFMSEFKIVNDAQSLRKGLDNHNNDKSNNMEENGRTNPLQEEEENKQVLRFSSQLIAQAGSHLNDGIKLGIGGLDDVLQEVRRRIWIPLSAPPHLLEELGVQPVRGLLLYGSPGCGKTLLARKLGQLLSPLRPVTVIAGPEVLDKFVGSSEANLREIFDNPPPIYEYFREHQQWNEQKMEALSKVALHVIVFDEFDAMARARGGRGGEGDQGDAGVARDSVVNQLLAKIDGVNELSVPTLIIALTNKRSLIDPALLRPGRFEVHIEVPPPRTIEQRLSILKVHTHKMFTAGRVLVSDAPGGTAAARLVKKEPSQLPSYSSLLENIAMKCDGFSGAALAGVCRAAASHALERAVEEGAVLMDVDSMEDCVVTENDFSLAIEDVMRSIASHVDKKIHV